jgi:hypothetical protein
LGRGCVMRSLNWPNLMTSGVTGHLVTRAYEEYCDGMSIHKPTFFNDSNDAFDYWVGNVGNDMYSLDTLLADAESLKNRLPNIVPTINDDDDALTEAWSAVTQIFIVGERIKACKSYEEFLELCDSLGERSFEVTGWDWDVYITLEIRLSLKDEYFRWGSYYNDGGSNIYESQAIIQNIDKFKEEDYLSDVVS